MKCYQTNPNTVFSTDFPISQCANIKHWGPQPKPTLIPYAQTRPKTDFTGLCLTIARLEGTQLFVDQICVWTWVHHGCWVSATGYHRVQGQNERENEKVICPSSNALTHAHTDFPRSHSSCRQPSSFRWRLRSERAIITSTKRLSHKLNRGMSSHEDCQQPTAEKHSWNTPVMPTTISYACSSTIMCFFLHHKCPATDFVYIRLCLITYMYPEYKSQLSIFVGLRKRQKNKSLILYLMMVLERLHLLSVDYTTL